MDFAAAGRQHCCTLYAGRALGEGMEVPENNLPDEHNREPAPKSNSGRDTSGVFFLSFSHDGAVHGAKAGESVVKEDELAMQSSASHALDSSGGALPIKRQQTWMGDRPGGDISLANAMQFPSAQFVTHFGFLVDDLVGEGSEVVLSRVRLSILCVYLANFVQRCATAVVFGLFNYY